MPIKSFTFAFKLDAKDLLTYVVERNMAVDIHATGTKRQEPEALPAPSVQLALPAPRRKPVSRNIVKAYFFKHQKETVTTVQVSELLKAAGFSPKTQHGLVFLLREQGFIKRVGKGQYRATAKLKKVSA